MNCTVIKNQQISSSYYKLTLRAEEIASKAKPGQFVMLKVNSGCDPLLRRPFAVHFVGIEGELELIYQVVGKGTTLLKSLLAGAQIDVLGPLGNNFTLPKAPHQGVILVAGAIGIAPLLFWAQELLTQHNYTPAQITLIVGGRGSADILAVPDFEDMGIEVHIATDNGSLGEKGLVTHLLENHLQIYPLPVYACGPNGMLKSVAQLAQKYNVPAQVSLEAGMACGVGACQGCVIKRKDVEGFKYQRVCKEGPVFEADSIIW